MRHRYFDDQGQFSLESVQLWHFYLSFAELSQLSLFNWCATRNFHIIHVGSEKTSWAVKWENIQIHSLMVSPVQLDPHSQLLSHPLIRNAESLPSCLQVFKVFFAAFAMLMSVRLYVRASSCLLTCASLMAGWVCKNSSTSLWCSSSASSWSWFSWWPSISTTSSAWCWSWSRCWGSGCCMSLWCWWWFSR